MSFASSVFVNTTTTTNTTNDKASSSNRNESETNASKKYKSSAINVCHIDENFEMNELVNNRTNNNNKNNRSASKMKIEEEISVNQEIPAASSSSGIDIYMDSPSNIQSINGSDIKEPTTIKSPSIENNLVISSDSVNVVCGINAECRNSNEILTKKVQCNNTSVNSIEHSCMAMFNEDASVPDCDLSKLPTKPMTMTVTTAEKTVTEIESSTPPIKSNEQMNGQLNGSVASPNTNLPLHVIPEKLSDSSSVSTTYCASPTPNGVPKTSNGALLNSNSADLVNGSNGSFPKIPFSMLAGELFHCKQELADGVVYLTNYRLHVKPTSKLEESRTNYRHHKQEQPINLGVSSIDNVELRDFYLIVFTKYVQSIVLKFQNAESAVTWHRRLNDMQNLKTEELFCFRFFTNFANELNDSYPTTVALLSIHRNQGNDPAWPLSQEFKRMNFGKNWKICELNKEFKFCNSYPQYFIVPRDVTDKDLEYVGSFRFSRRIPVPVWRSKKNGCIIARSSQPMFGWLGWRSSHDERLLQKMMSICNRDTQECYSRTKNEPNSQSHSFKSNGTTCATNNVNGDASTEPLSSPSRGSNELMNGHAASNGSLAGHYSMDGLNDVSGFGKFLILDARSYTAAIANRTLGGGCECPEYYTNCDVQFMGLNNIHNVRKSFFSLRSICEQGQIDQPNWLTMLDSTKWLHNLAALLKASMVVVDAISIQERPVLVHCSDGWDRTPQVVALAELILDRYYRTIEGFQVLIEREWLQFGHKFTDRCRSTSLNIDPNERCPVFLQWLDCVYQLLRQFPLEFEFNVYLLIKLVYHTYSNLFGTFTCNNAQERVSHQVNERTISFWSYINLGKANYINYLYAPEQEVLKPNFRLKDIFFWEDVYAPMSGISQSIILNCEISNQKSVRNQQIVNLTSNDHDSISFNEANIYESCVQSSSACEGSTKDLSHSKSDLHRWSSADNVSKTTKTDLNGALLCGSQQGLHFAQSDCSLRIRHLSDSFLFEGNEISNDCDRFILSSTSQNNDQICDIDGQDCCTIDDTATCTIDEICNLDDDGMTNRVCNKVGKDVSKYQTNGFVSDVSHLALLPDNGPDIDGQTIAKDKSYLQLQHLIKSYQEEIANLKSALRYKQSCLRCRCSKSQQNDDAHSSRKHSHLNGDCAFKHLQLQHQHLDALDLFNCDKPCPLGGNGKIKSKEETRTKMAIQRPRSVADDRTQ